LIYESWIIAGYIDNNNKSTRPPSKVATTAPHSSDHLITTSDTTVL
jgi:hypothetical protein